MANAFQYKRIAICNGNKALKKGNCPAVQEWMDFEVFEDVLNVTHSMWCLAENAILKRRRAPSILIMHFGICFCKCFNHIRFIINHGRFPSTRQLYSYQPGRAKAITYLIEHSRRKSWSALFTFMSSKIHMIGQCRYIFARKVREVCDLPSLRAWAIGDSGIIRIQAHTIQTIMWMLFCCFLWEPSNHLWQISILDGFLGTYVDSAILELSLLSDFLWHSCFEQGSYPAVTPEILCNVCVASQLQTVLVALFLSTMSSCCWWIWAGSTNHTTGNYWTWEGSRNPRAGNYWNCTDPINLTATNYSRLELVPDGTQVETTGF